MPIRRNRKRIRLKDGQVRIGRTIIDKSDLPLESYLKKPVLVHAMKVYETFWVQTMEGLMKGDRGDYLIMGVEGELYPCKASVFKKTYEKVSLL
jgi:hypothetical protein